MMAALLPSWVGAQGLPERAAAKLQGDISVDGAIEESDWEQADLITGFRQYEPDEGLEASQNTEVRVLYGNGNVYIGATLYDENPDQIQRTLGRRDDYNRADWFLVSIDSYNNNRNAYSFGVNAAGVQLDALRSSGGRGGGGLPDGMDPSWDAVWESAVQVHDRGWSVEIRIPNTMLRFSDMDLQTWGIHFTRRIPRLGEVSEWPLVPRTERSNLIALFGELTEIRNMEPKPNIQVRPYTVAGLNSRESVTTPGTANVSTDIDLGSDFKVGLGPNVTLDATINPDFGQVESDPAVLNLTAFETFFDERRPFFVEGIRIYEFSVGPGELLYTRRIGAQAPIIGAAKVSGQTEKGTSFGLLGSTAGTSFDPSRNYGVARVRQQFGEYSEAGVIFTGFDAPSEFGSGRIQSTSGGVDWDVRFNDNAYGVEGFSAFTNRTWTNSGIDSQNGFAGKVWLRKRQGIITGFAGADVFSDQFNPNDIGQLRQNNFIANLVRAEYQINGGKPFGGIQQADIGTFIVQRFSYDERLNLGLELRAGSNWTLAGFQDAELGFSTERPFGGYDLFETRGQGPWARPATYQVQVDYRTDSRRTWWLSPEGNYTWHEGGGKDYTVELRGGMDIGSRLSFSGQLEGQFEKGVTAWASNETFRNNFGIWLIGERSARPDQLGPGEYSLLQNPQLLNSIFSDVPQYSPANYYVPVFGDRDTRSLNFTLRSDLTFTSTLSLQLYSQMFLARGKYKNFQIMQNPDRLAPYDDYPKQDEFSLSSLQSNLVLRWEYRPGSNIYLVWTHGRRLRESLNPLAPHGASAYDQSIGQRIQDTFEIFPENALLLKVEYTFLY